MQMVEKKAGVAILMSDKIVFKTNTVTREKKALNIMIKGSIQQEDIQEDITLVKYMHPT